MKYILSNWMIEFAHSASKIPLVKLLFKPFYYRFKKSLDKKRNLNFHRFSLSMLQDFDIIMQENAIPYTLIFGSLLGAIREKGFIKHDLDVDIAIFYDDTKVEIAELLSQRGFQLIRRFSVDGGSLGCEETYEYKKTGVSLDIFYIYPAIDDYPYCCCWNLAEGCASFRESVKKIGGVYPRRIEQPVSREIERVRFETIEVSITKNAKQCLEFAYGSDYMTPNPNYIVPKEHRYVWYEKIAKYETF